MNTNHIIVISGVARSGKDTLANAIAKEMHDTHHIQGQVFKFANPLKGSLQTAVQAVGLGYVDVWTEDSDLKAALRPLLVEFGKYCRSINRDVFVNKTLSDIEDAQRLSPLTHIVPIISDLRYLNEIQRVQSWVMHQKVNTKIFWAHILRENQGPANEEEKRSLDELGQFCMPSSRRLFLEGDVNGISRWAKDIALEVCGGLVEVDKNGCRTVTAVFKNKTLAATYTDTDGTTRPIDSIREVNLGVSATERFGAEEVEKRNAKMVEDMKAMKAWLEKVELPPYRLGVDLDELLKRVESVASNVGELLNKTQTLDEEMHSQDEIIDRVSQRVDSQKDNITYLIRRVGALEDRADGAHKGLMSDLDAIEDLGQRVKHLETFPTAELRDAILGIKLGLERMDARLKRMEAKDQPNF